jgi:hypothetical protein
MLDLKLALYLPFLEIMQPGVFITASDDIEVFNIDQMPTAGDKKIFTTLIKKKMIFSSYIRKFRMEPLQCHI